VDCPEVEELAVAAHGWVAAVRLAARVRDRAVVALAVAAPLLAAAELVVAVRRVQPRSH